MCRARTPSFWFCLWHCRTGMCRVFSWPRRLCPIVWVSPRFSSCWPGPQSSRPAFSRDAPFWALSFSLVFQAWHSELPSSWTLFAKAYHRFWLFGFEKNLIAFFYWKKSTNKDTFTKENTNKDTFTKGNTNKDTFTMENTNKNTFTKANTKKILLSRQSPIKKYLNMKLC